MERSVFSYQLPLPPSPQVQPIKPEEAAAASTSCSRVPSQNSKGPPEEPSRLRRTGGEASAASSSHRPQTCTPGEPGRPRWCNAKLARARGPCPDAAFSPSSAFNPFSTLPFFFFSAFHCRESFPLCDYSAVRKRRRRREDRSRASKGRGDGVNVKDSGTDSHLRREEGASASRSFQNDSCEDQELTDTKEARGFRSPFKRINAVLPARSNYPGALD